MKISIKGPIISNNDQWFYDWIGWDAVSPSKIINLIDQAVNNEELEIDINSGGGSVYDASEIYTAIKSYPGKTTGRIVGLAASAASVIAMAVDDLKMAPTAQMMIHNAKTRAEGDHNDMANASTFLKNVNQTIANAYSIKSGKSYDELLALMDAETWLTPQQAKELNLIDEILFENQEAPMVVASSEPVMVPEEVINKLRDELLKNNMMPTVTNYTSKHKEEPINMNIEELKNNHIDLYNEVFNLGKTEGVKAENERIKSIENVSMTGYEELVNKAKFETMESAETLAVNILKAQKEQGQNYLQNRNNDALKANSVPGTHTPTNEDAENAQEQEVAANMAAIINKQRGGLR